MKATVQLQLLLAAMLSLLESAVASQDPVVSTKNGDVSGAILKSFLGNDYFSFKGIPYAKPPLGGMRFRPPQAHQGWSGIRDAKNHGEKCLQFAMFSGALEGAEDCLFLNVYSPRLPSDGEMIQLPVMVWIHGGGFIFGEGDATPLFGPEYFMDQQVVLVTLNYRLGPFGFLTTADEAAPGNYGLHDQVLALRWVQANIAAFGGDPDAVTIFGESAGGASVGLQVLSPRSSGLFRRAISQSGASFCNFAASGEPQGQVVKDHAELLGCETSSSKTIVDCLRQKPANEIIMAMSKLNSDLVVGLQIFYKPRVDAESQAPFLPEDPYVALEEGRFDHVPWMNGMNSDEGAFMIGMLEMEKPPKYASLDWNVWAESIFAISKVTDHPSKMAERIYRHYFGEDPVNDGNLDRLVHIFTDRTFTGCISSEIDLASAHTTVYKYILDHKGPGRQSFAAILSSMTGKEANSNRDFGVSHTDDLLYLFKNALAPPITTESDEHKMIRFMVSVWASFARQGYPSTDVLAMPRWPIYTTTEQEHMWLNVAPSVGRAAFSERARFWKQLDIREHWRARLSCLARDEL